VSAAAGQGAATGPREPLSGALGGPLSERLRVAVVYHVWPHYRQPVMRAMDASAAIAYDFYGSGEALDGVIHADTGAVSRFVRAPFRRLGSLLWQPGAVAAASDRRYQALILLADPHFVSTWVAALIAKARRRPVLFWGHGWLRHERGLKRLVRHACFALCDRFLVYGERGKRIGAREGFALERITVVSNSLDVARANAVIARIEAGTLRSVRPQSLFAVPEHPLLVCTARLTRACRFDLLIDAAALLAARGLPVNVLLVGEGPERAALERRAADLGVSAHFFGACYDEDVTGQLLYHSDVTVSPGKIGLTAMHSLMYGTPAITHGDFDTQMPEVEAIEQGVTGAFFRKDDAASLADAIARWLAQAPPREIVRAAARAAIARRWTPEHQARTIEQAVLEVARRG